MAHLTHKACYEITRDSRSESLSNAKRDAKKAAKGLFYSNDVIDAISNTKTEADITRIMRNARKNNK